MNTTRLLILLTVAASNAVQGGVDYNRDVRPILSDRCVACHGPDAKKREAGLRLDTLEGATGLLESGVRAIVPGKPEESALVSRIHASDPDDLMPPAKLGRPLTAAEQEMLVTWIREGAGYTQHWAYVTPVRHEAPPVKNTAWARDDMDRFILARLEEAGLEPAAEADRAALLRRASFVLTGLPPSPEELAAFAADVAPDAYEKVIDRLLASPRYGERMAQDWLDVARFADTYGYQSDNSCFVWPWRDWVLRAFNENLPYDKFLTWQLAGDLLPEATQDQRLATLFNRLHRQTQEGGSIEQEFRQEYISDRVHTAGTAFLGLTMECAKCHDHKYDPLPQADYYSMASMFGQIDECGLFPYSISTTAPEPSMRLEEPHHGMEIRKREAALASARETAAKVQAGRGDAFTAWLRDTPAVPAPVPSDHFPLDARVEGKFPNSIAGGAPAACGPLESVPGAVGQAVKFDGDTILMLDGVKGITRHDPLTISLRLYTPERKARALIMHTGPALFSQMADASGFELLMEEGRLRWSCIHLWPGCAASVEMTEEFPIGKWVDVTVTWDGSSTAAGLRMYCDGQPTPTAVLRDELDKNITAEVMKLGARPRDDRGFADGFMDEIKIFRQRLSAVEVADLHEPCLPAVLEKARVGNADSLEAMRAHFVERVDAECAAARAAVTAARKSLEDDYLHHIPLIMSMKDAPRKKQHYVLTRGDYASPDKTRPVEPAAPAAIMPFPAEYPRNRLGLARWMTDAKNPLVPRVAVNRLWAQCFGTGIVLTQENLGMQGDAPSHPELLDSLAADFVREGWDVKRLLRRILLSAAFRQSSVNTALKKERDPANRLVSRGPAYRLSGEAIRDQALLAAGLLVEKLGGPSVKPWQPPGVWSEAGASGGDYTPDQGEGLHRRSLYTFRKRTAPPPAMLTLDAGSREICQPRRLTTNTPLQPLIFLNDQSFFECARRLAARVMQENPGNTEAGMRRAFLLLTSREPASEELDALRALHARLLTNYSADSAAARAVAPDAGADLAAMTVLCSTLLTSDAAITNR